MNHQKFYDSIINNAKSENRIKLRKINPEFIYYENHHIIPKYLGGTNDKENLVLLTAREHYVCHKLLTYIYKGNRKISLAFHKMSFGVHKEKYNVSSRDYEYARELLILTPISLETRKKLSKSGKGRISPMKGKHHSKETKEKMSNALTGIKRSEETKEKQRNANIGEKNPMFGKSSHFLGTHLSNEKKKYLSNLYKGKTIEELYGKEKAEKIKEKLSNNAKGRINSEETKEKRNKKLKGRKRTEEQKKKISEGTRLALKKLHR